jgi:hypothetical protein
MLRRRNGAARGRIVTGVAREGTATLAATLALATAGKVSGERVIRMRLVSRKRVIRMRLVSGERVIRMRLVSRKGVVDIRREENWMFRLGLISRRGVVDVRRKIDRVRRETVRRLDFRRLRICLWIPTDLHSLTSRINGNAHFVPFFTFFLLIVSGISETLEIPINKSLQPKRKMPLLSAERNRSSSICHHFTNGGRTTFQKSSR